MASNKQFPSVLLLSAHYNFIFITSHRRHVMPKFYLPSPLPSVTSADGSPTRRLAEWQFYIFPLHYVITRFVFYYSNAMLNRVSNGPGATNEIFNKLPSTVFAWHRFFSPISGVITIGENISIYYKFNVTIDSA